MANLGAQTNGAHDLRDLLGMDMEDFDSLTEDAIKAVEDLYDELTVFDYSDCNRYWDADIDEDGTNALIEKYHDRIWDENGDARTR